MEGEKVTVADIERTFANPFYCGAMEQYVGKYEPIVTEEEWIKVGVKVIGEIGAEAYLKRLLEAIKSDETPMGYKDGRQED
jgi:hypothetical protein